MSRRWPAWLNGSLVDPLVMHRPYLLELYNCSDVAVVGISLHHSPFWTVHPYVSTRVELRGLSILAPVGSPNTDGIDPDSSSYVTIADTTIENGLHWAPERARSCDKTHWHPTQPFIQQGMTALP